MRVVRPALPRSPPATTRPHAANHARPARPANRHMSRHAADISLSDAASRRWRFRLQAAGGPVQTLKFAMPPLSRLAPCGRRREAVFVVRRADPARWLAGEGIKAQERRRFRVAGEQLREQSLEPR